MDFSIALLLAQDGVTNGAIYALLALALVLVFTVTRVIFVPSGEFVTYGTLTLAALQLGKPPGTVGLLLGLAAVAGSWRFYAAAREHDLAPAPTPARAVRRSCPVAIAGIVYAAAPMSLAFPLQILLTVAIVTALGTAAVSRGVSAAGGGVGTGAADRVGRCAFHHGRAGTLVLRCRRLADAAVHERHRSVWAT